MGAKDFRMAAAPVAVEAPGSKAAMEEASSKEAVDIGTLCWGWPGSKISLGLTSLVDTSALPSDPTDSTGFPRTKTALGGVPAEAIPPTVAQTPTPIPTSAVIPPSTAAASEMMESKESEEGTAALAEGAARVEKAAAAGGGDQMTSTAPPPPEEEEEETSKEGEAAAVAASRVRAATARGRRAGGGYCGGAAAAAATVEVERVGGRA